MASRASKERSTELEDIRLFYSRGDRISVSGSDLMGTDDTYRMQQIALQILHLSLHYVALQ
jgi:hypothetical protein